MKRVVVGIVAAACLLPAALWAQAVTGTILGAITDSTGAVMPGVTVTLTNAGTGLVRVVVRNHGALTARQVKVRCELDGPDGRLEASRDVDISGQAPVVVDLPLALPPSRHTIWPRCTSSER